MPIGRFNLRSRNQINQQEEWLESWRSAKCKLERKFPTAKPLSKSKTAMLQERLLASAIIAKTLSLQVLSERAVYKSWARRTGRIFTKNHNNHKSSIKNQLPEDEAPPFPPNKKKGLVHLIGTAVNVKGIPAAKVYPAVQRGVDSAKSCLFGFPMFQQVDAKKGYTLDMSKGREPMAHQQVCVVQLYGHFLLEKRCKKLSFQSFPKVVWKGPQGLKIRRWMLAKRVRSTCKAAKEKRQQGQKKTTLWKE